MGHSRRSDRRELRQVVASAPGGVGGVHGHDHQAPLCPVYECHRVVAAHADHPEPGADKLRELRHRVVFPRDLERLLAVHQVAVNQPVVVLPPQAVLLVLHRLPQHPRLRLHVAQVEHDPGGEVQRGRHAGVVVSVLVGAHVELGHVQPLAVPLGRVADLRSKLPAVRMRVDAGDHRPRRLVVGLERPGGGVHPVRIHRTDPRGADALGPQGGRQGPEDPLLGFPLEVAALLAPVSLPPLGVRLVHRVDRVEGDVPLRLEVLHDGREVVGEVVIGVLTQVVAPPILRARRAAADGHRPGRRVGEGLGDVRPALDGGLQHPALVGVGGPVVGAVPCGAVSGHGPGGPHVLVSRCIPAADVVANDVEPQALVGVEQQVGDPGPLRIFPATDPMAEPAQGTPPAVGDLILRRGIEGNSLLPVGDGPPSQQQARKRHRRPSRRAVLRGVPAHCIHLRPSQWATGSIVRAQREILKFPLADRRLMD